MSNGVRKGEGMRGRRSIRGGGAMVWNLGGSVRPQAEGLARILIAINTKIGFLTKCSQLTISLTSFLERSRESQLVTARITKTSRLIRIK